MNRIIYLIFIIMGLCACKSKKETTNPPVATNVGGKVLPVREKHGQGMEYSPNTLIIMVDTLVGKEPLYEAIKQYGATLKYDYNLIPGVAIRIPDGKTLEESIAYFKKVKGVASVSKDRITRLTDPVKPRLTDK